MKKRYFDTASAQRERAHSLENAEAVSKSKKTKSVKSQLNIETKSFRKIKNGEKLVDWLKDLGVKEKYINDIENTIDRISHETSSAREQKLMDKLADLSDKIGKEYKDIFWTNDKKEYLTDAIFDSMSTFGEFKNGGKTKPQMIPNNYKGKTAKQIWNGWTQGQRLHFLEDHYLEFNKLMQDDVHEFVTDKYDQLDSSIIGSLKKHISMGEYEDGGLVLYKDEDLAAFWNNPKNENKTIFFVEEMHDEDDNRKPEHYFVVGSQNKKGYKDSGYWEFDGHYGKMGDAIKAAMKQAKKTKGGIYAENLRLIRGYEDGGKLNNFFSKAKDLAKKGAAKTKAAYEKAKPHVKDAAEKTATATKKAYATAKQTVKQKIHDEKKKIALEVIDDTKDRYRDNQDKMVLKAAEARVDEAYENGGKTYKFTGRKGSKAIAQDSWIDLKKGDEFTVEKQYFRNGEHWIRTTDGKDFPSTFFWDKKKNGGKTVSVKSKMKSENGGTYSAGGKTTGSVRVTVSGGVAEVEKCPKGVDCYIIDKDLLYQGETYKYNGTDYDDSEKLLKDLKADYKKSGKKYAIVTVHGGVAYEYASKGAKITIKDYDNEMEDGGISPQKARKILHEGKAHGKNITDKQRRFFGARASGYPVKRKSDGGPTKNWVGTGDNEELIIDYKWDDLEGLYEFLGDNNIITANEINPDHSQYDYLLLNGEDIYFLKTKNLNELKKDGRTILEMEGKLDKFIDKDNTDHREFMEWLNGDEKMKNGGKTGNIKDEAIFTYTKFLDRCLEYFDKFNPLHKAVKTELESVRHKEKAGVEHAIRYYHDKTKHKAEIFTHAGADELAKAFMKASRKAEDEAYPLHDKKEGGGKTQEEKTEMKLYHAHEKEAKRKKANIVNLGWVSSPTEIASKTSEGILESKIDTKTGHITHKWE